MSVVLMKGQATFITCYVRAPDVWEPRSEPHSPCCKSGTAFQSTNLSPLNKLFVTLDSCNKITLHTVMTWPPVSTVCFKIWNPIFVVFAMCDNVWCKALCIDAVNRFRLMVYNIINYNDITAGRNSYVFIGNVHCTDIKTLSPKWPKLCRVGR